jgi:hypothetical protein
MHLAMFSSAFGESVIDKQLASHAGRPDLAATSAVAMIVILLQRLGELPEVVDNQQDVCTMVQIPPVKPAKSRSKRNLAAATQLKLF